MGNNWRNRERKVNSRRDSKFISKPFKRPHNSDTEGKKKSKMQIKKAQRAKYIDIEPITED